MTRRQALGGMLLALALFRLSWAGVAVLKSRLEIGIAPRLNALSSSPEARGRASLGSSFEPLMAVRELAPEARQVVVLTGSGAEADRAFAALLSLLYPKRVRRLESPAPVLPPWPPTRDPTLVVLDLGTGARFPPGSGFEEVGSGPGYRLWARR